MRRMSVPADPPTTETQLLINPRAGRGRGQRCAADLHRRLEDRGLCVRASVGSGPGDIEARARAAATAGSRRLIVAGGDGALHEAVNGIMASGRDVALGLVPLGTGNDFAKAAGIPRDWRAAADRVVAQIRRDAPRRIDVGRCNGFYFVNGLGAGLDAVVTRDAERLKWLPGGAAYVTALLGLLARGAPRASARIEHEGGVLEEEIAFVTVCNGQWLGGAFHFAPRARIDDGRLDVVASTRLSRRQIIRYAPKVMRGQHEDLPVARVFETRRLRVTLDRPLILEADGEIRDRKVRQLEVELLPGALGLLA
jgi:diacylglycerol kinase (ATP)